MMSFPSSFSNFSRFGQLRQNTSRVGGLRQLTGLAVAIALPLTLAGCGDNDNTAFAPTCPEMHIPAEVADYYNYAQKGATFDHLVTRASITQLGGMCLPTGKKGLRTQVGVHMVVRRGPASTSDTLTLPWFVAVVHGDKIVGKHVFKQQVTFANSTASVVAVDTPLVSVDLPIKPTNGLPEYRFEVGFQLTAEQLAYNREHGISANFATR